MDTNNSDINFYDKNKLIDLISKEIRELMQLLPDKDFFIILNVIKIRILILLRELPLVVIDIICPILLDNAEKVYNFEEKMTHQELVSIFEKNEKKFCEKIKDQERRKKVKELILSTKETIFKNPKLKEEIGLKAIKILDFYCAYIELL